MSDIIVLETTFPNQKSAHECGKELVHAKFAACCHLFPVLSLYTWKGKLEEGEECVLRIKSSRKCKEKLISFLQSSHPYDVPEILVYSIEESSPSYEEWVLEELGGDG